MPAKPTEAAVRDRLDDVIDPCSEANGTNLSVIEMGLLDAIEIDGGHVHVDLHVTSPHCMMTPFFVDEISERVGELEPVSDVTVDFDAGMEWTPEMITEDGRRKRDRRRSERRRRPDP